MQLVRAQLLEIFLIPYVGTSVFYIDPIYIILKKIQLKISQMVKLLFGPSYPQPNKTHEL